MHLVPLPLWGQGHGDAGALTGSAIQITEALQAGRKRLRSCQWTVNTGADKLRTLWPFSGLPFWACSSELFFACCRPVHWLGPSVVSWRGRFTLAHPRSGERGKYGLSEIVGKICGKFYNWHAMFHCCLDTVQNSRRESWSNVDFKSCIILNFHDILSYVFQCGRNCAVANAGWRSLVGSIFCSSLCVCWWPTLPSSCDVMLSTFVFTWHNFKISSFASLYESEF